MRKMKKRPGVRATSNIFAMFDQGQIQEFKEVCLIKKQIKMTISVGIQYDRSEQRWFH